MTQLSGESEEKQSGMSSLDLDELQRLREENNSLRSRVACLEEECDRERQSRVLAEARHRESDAKFQTLYESGVVGVAIWREDGSVVDVNDTLLGIFGLSREELSGFNWRERTPPEFQHLDEIAMKQMAMSDRFEAFEKEFTRADGSRIAVRLAGVKLPGPDAKGISFMVDLTPRRRAEAEVREKAESLLGILAASVDHIYVVGADSRYRYVSDGGAKVLGLKPHQMTGKTWQELGLPEETMTAFDAQRDEVLQNGKPLRREQFFRESDGSLHTYEYIIVPLATTGLPDAVVVVSRDVTDRYRLESERKERDRLYGSILDNVTAVVYVKDLTGRYLLVNQYYCDVLGRSREEILGKRDADLFDAATAETFLRNDRTVIAKGCSQQFEESTPHPDGPHTYVSIKFPLRDPTGEINAVCGISTDIEQQKRSARVLERYRLLAEHTRDVIFFMRTDGQIVEANRAAETTYGYDHETLLTMNVGELRDIDTREDIQPQLAEAAAKGTRFETLHRHRDGTSFPVEVSSRGADVAGERLLVSVVRDVSQRRRTEEQLQEQKALLSAITDNADSALLMIDAAGKLTFVNPAFTRATGYSAEEAIGRGVHDLLHHSRPDGRDYPIEQCPIDAAFRRGQPKLTEHDDIFVRKDGSFFPVVVSVAPLRDRGILTGCVAEFRDVSVERDVRDALVKNEHVGRFLADAGAVLAELDDQDRTLQKVAELAVPRFADWCAIDILEGGQFRRVAVSHSNPDKIALAHEYHSKFPPSFDDPVGLWKIARTGEPELLSEITQEMVAAIGTDEKRMLLDQLGLRSYIGVPLKVRDEILGVLTFVEAESGRLFDSKDLLLAEDIARRTAVAIENVRLYDGLREADKRKNDFLAMLGHELRNPLAPIRTGLDLLRLEGVGGETVDLMAGQVDHVVRLVDDLLDVSRILRGRVELRRQPMDLREAVRSAEQIVQPSFAARQQKFFLELPDCPIYMEADSVRITQVLTNLLNNASKYTEPGGSIWLTASLDKRDVQLSVRDTGIGIEPDLLPHVFQLFTQSTRSLDRSQGGLGIGLTIVQNLVEMHGGSVAVSSAGVEQGSEFVVKLPLLDSPAFKLPEESAEPNERSLKILVVDDNVPAAKLLVRLLAKLGTHEIVTAHDGEGALAAAEAYRPELIFLDIGLPRPDGYEVCRRLRSIAAFDDTLLVALTGYGTEEDRRRSAEAGFDEHVTKPPSIKSLRSVLSHAKLSPGGNSDPS